MTVVTGHEFKQKMGTYLYNIFSILVTIFRFY